MYYDPVRQIICQLSCTIPSGDIRRWVVVDESYWMALFESLDLLTESRPPRNERNNKLFHQYLLPQPEKEQPELWDVENMSLKQQPSSRNLSQKQQLNSRSLSQENQEREESNFMEVSPEVFMNQEKQWIEWIVDGLRQCRDVPPSVRDSSLISHVVSLLKLMDRWNLWKEGDEAFIACKLWRYKNEYYEFSQRC